MITKFWISSRVTFLVFFFVFCSSQGNPLAATEVKQNLNEENNSYIDVPQICLFIHVCTINHWKLVLHEQLSRIKRSGLYDACDSIFLGVLGKGNLNEFLNQYPKLGILFKDSNTTLYERATLSQLYKLCKCSPKNTLVLYLHSKGVSRTEPHPYITDWNHYMEYFAIDRWEDCVAALQSHDVCGVNWRTYPVPHFSGNFWWARASYITTLPEKIGPDYYDPEFWIGLNAPKVKCFHESNIVHYWEPYPESKYKLTD